MGKFYKISVILGKFYKISVIILGFSFLETRNASVRAIRVQITFRSVYVYHSEFHNSFSIPSVLTQIGVKLVAKSWKIPNKSWKIPSVFLNITMRIRILVLLMLQDLTKEILTAHTTCGSFIRQKLSQFGTVRLVKPKEGGGYGGGADPKPLGKGPRPMILLKHPWNSWIDRTSFINVSSIWLRWGEPVPPLTSGRMLPEL